MSDVVNAAPAAPVSEAPENTDRPRLPSAGSAAGGSGAAAAPQDALGSFAAKKWQLKVDGKAHTIDSEDKLVMLAQKGMGAERRFAEAARIQREHEELKSRVRQSPREVLRQLGLSDEDARGVFESELRGEIEREMLTPEQRRMQALEQRATSAEQKLQQEHEARQQAAFEQTVAAQNEILTRTITEALESGVGLPKTESTAARMADMLLECMEMGIEPSPKQLAEQVAEELRHEQLSLWETMSYDQLIKHVPDAVLNKLRKGDLARFKAKRSSAGNTPNPTLSAPTQPRDAGKREYLSRDEWIERLEKKVGG